VTPIPAIPSDWKKVSIPGSSLTFGLPSDWEISESKAGRVTARKRVPTSDSASTEQLMKDIDKYGDWFVEVTIMEGVPATRLSLMKAMEGRVVQAEVIGWLSWVWAGNLISVKYRDDGTFDDMSAY
jgi:hypothetical protein